MVSVSGAAPILSINTGASLAEGGLDTILQTALATTDSDTAAADLVYLVTTGTAHGTLFNDVNDNSLIDDGEALAGGSTFTQADIDLGLLRYLHDGSETTADSFSFTVSDGETDLAGNSFAFTVSAVNDAPTIVAPATMAVVEDVASAIIGISIADTDAGSAVIFVTLSVDSGTLNAAETAGVAVRDAGTGSMLLAGTLANIQAFIDGGAVTFTTAANATADVLLTAVIDDRGNSGSGGALTSSTTITLQVDAVNDAPTVAAPASIPVLEDTPKALTGISFADVDAGGASVTVTLAVASGVLAATTAGGVTVTNSGTDTITLTGAITDINSFISGSAVIFNPVAETSGDVTLTIGIDDGGNSGAGGAQTADTTVTLAVAAVNDAPGVTMPGPLAGTEDTPMSITGISFADVDAGGASVTVTLAVASGVLAATTAAGVTVANSGTDTITLTGAIADINAFISGSAVGYTPDADVNGDVALTATINDGGNTGSGGAQTGTDSTTLQLAAVNDAPEVTAPATLAVAEDTASALTGISFADVDAGSSDVTVTLAVDSGTLAAVDAEGVAVLGSETAALTLTGTVAAINAFIAASAVTFTSALDTLSDVTLTVAINDGGASGSGGPLGDSATVTLEVAGTNDAPVVTAPATLTVTEDTAGVVSGISFADLEAGMPGFGDAGTPEVTVTLSVDSGTLSVTGATGLVVGGNGTDTLTLTGYIGDINDCITRNEVRFTTAQDSVADVALTVAIDDLGNTGLGGALTDSAIVTIHVTGVNDAPEVTAPATLAVTEDVASALTGFSFADVDAGSAVVTATLSVDSGTLTATGVAVTVPAGVIATGLGTDTLTLTGTIAAINALIAAGAVTFTTAADATADVTLTAAMTDGGNSGSGGALSGSATLTLEVTPVDDLAVLKDDAFTTTDVGTVSGDLFADNGAGADGDIDSVLAITAVNGGAAAVDAQITLTSGALLTVNADGTFDYDPNGAFEHLPLGVPATDSFTYSAGGATATVTITLNGIDNRDFFQGNTDADLIDSGIENDTIYGDAGDDTLLGQSGDDYIQGNTGADRILGGTGNDELRGGQQNDTIQGEGDNDTLYGALGNDMLSGGAGADTIYGGGGTDTVYYDQSADYVVTDVALGVTVNLVTGTGMGGEADGDVLFEIENVTGTDSADNLTGNDLANVLQGNLGADVLYGNSGNDLLDGGGDADFLQGNFGSDTLYGGAGDDELRGGQDNDLLSGGAGADLLVGAKGTDTATYECSGAGVDVELADSAGLDSGTGLGGDAEGDILLLIENLTGSDYGDTLAGNDVANVLQGRGGNDFLAGFAGNDLLNGGADTDFLFGGIDDDTLIGGGGVDYLFGEAGANTLIGGEGADAFIFGSFLSDPIAIGAQVDTIFDFEVGLDVIALDGTLFTTLVPGDPDGVALGDTLIFDESDMKLYYDADGVAGAGVAIHIATIIADGTLSGMDFLIIT